MIRSLMMLVMLLSLHGVTWAQNNPTLTEAERGIRDGDEDAVHLRIDVAHLRAHLVGRTADVTLEMTIASDSEDNYEANLALLLPVGAVVTGYALDVGGAMIPGQLLEAPKARNVYEDEVRQGIDPGLAEVAGNRFTTRIFPIDAARPRRFRIQFVTAYDPELGLQIPFARDIAIGAVSVEVTADGFATPPVVRFSGQPIDLARSGNGWWVQANLGKAMVREGLTATGGMLTAPLAISRHPSGEQFLTISDETGSRAPAPRFGGRLRIYWDRSLSHQSDRTDLEAAVLARLVEQTRPAGIDLVTFASDRPRVFSVSSGEGLKTALAKVTYLGGTSFPQLDALSLPAASQCIIVSDGNVTIDRGVRLAPDCRLTALTSAPGADGARLARLVQQTGGTVVRLAPGGEAEALAALTSRYPTPVSVRDAAGRRIDSRTVVTGPGRWHLVGPAAQGGDFTVSFSDGTERRYARPKQSFSSAAPGALWAAAKVAELGDDPARHAAMAALSRRYSVAGPGMSFLVLEQPEQYVRADIAVPVGFDAEWIAEYREAIKERDESRKNAQAERLEFVLEQWQARREWWRQRFTPAPSRAGKDRRQPPPPVLAVPAPPPPPPPPPSAEAPTNQSVQAVTTVSEESAEDAGSVIVTATRRRDPVPAVQDAAPATITIDMENLIARRPYIDALTSAPAQKRMTVLIEQERQYGSVPTFYLDTAEWFRLKGDTATAALLLLSALELPTSDDETRQIVAFRLERDGSFDRAIELAEHLASANAQFRPQPGRDLALALAARGKKAGKAGRKDLERAFQLLVDTALNPASDDFDGIEVVALMEANALIPLIEKAGGRWALDPRLVGLTDVDARIVIAWTADDADIDLWVDEPNGERVMYSNKLSSAGGQISNDMTDGYGPEEYAIHRAAPGPYAVRVNGYDADRINPNGPGHVLIRLQRNFARPFEDQELVDLDLSFQSGRDRNEEDETRAIATMRVVN